MTMKYILYSEYGDNIGESSDEDVLHELAERLNLKEYSIGIVELPNSNQEGVESERGRN